MAFNLGARYLSEMISLDIFLSSKYDSLTAPTSASLMALKPLTVWITNWKILKEMGIPDPFTCLLRNLYAG